MIQKNCFLTIYAEKLEIFDIFAAEKDSKLTIFKLFINLNFRTKNGHCVGKSLQMSH